ncbi:unnamed protein product [Peniophora sp. CBMAI 1063]|nr:unnamed protein product [Peniophora sp. CBMAI 1063]
MSESNSIILYDFPRKGPQNMSDSEQSWSGNTLKTRYALNIKRLPYRTEWVRLSGVEAKMKPLGLKPSQPGPMPYTLPTIMDTSTGQVINDSFAIAQYLDKTYPDTPMLIPPGTAALQRAFVDKVVTQLLYEAVPVLMRPVYTKGCLDDADAAHYRRTREAWYGGKPLEEIMKMGDKGLEKTCEAFRKGLDDIERYAKEAGGGDHFVGEEGPWFADTAVAAALMFTLKMCGEEHALSKVILEHEWASQFLVKFQKWM